MNLILHATCFNYLLFRNYIFFFFFLICCCITLTLLTLFKRCFSPEHLFSGWRTFSLKNRFTVFSMSSLHTISEHAEPDESLELTSGAQSESQTGKSWSLILRGIRAYTRHHARRTTKRTRKSRTTLRTSHKVCEFPTNHASVMEVSGIGAVRVKLPFPDLKRHTSDRC